MTPFLRFTSVFLTFSSCLLGADTKSLEEWWKGKKVTGDWFGARTTLEDRGIDFFRTLVQRVCRRRLGWLQHRGTFVEQVNLSHLFGRRALERRRPYQSLRRDDSLFGPVNYRSGHGWSLMPFYLTYTTPQLFGIKEFLTVSGGWQNANDIFAEQPESKFFRNNGIIDNKVHLESFVIEVFYRGAGGAAEKEQGPHYRPL